MTKRGKLLLKLQDPANNLAWTELQAALKSLGYHKIEGRGSRVKFVKEDSVVDLHRPHPGNEVKAYVRKLVIAHLTKRGEI